jgi:NADH dehydrogenase FAD-containing subunit
MEAPKPTKKIVILGGSYGGVSTAHYTLQHTIPKLPDSSNYQVVLISISSQVFCRPAAPRALLADSYFDQKKLFLGVPGLFEQYPAGSFAFIQAHASAWDHDKKIVTIEKADGAGSEEIEYYALIIATGCSTLSPLFGYNLGSEQEMKDSWKTIREKLPEAKSVLIAGGGPAGIETAGEIGEHFNGKAGFFSSKIEKPKKTVTVVTSGKQILPLLRKSIADKGEAALGKVGVTVVKDIKVTSVEPADAGQPGPNLFSPTKVNLSDGKSMDVDLYIPATGFSPNTQFVTDKTLLASDGRVHVDPLTFRVEKAGPLVYAVGDVADSHRPAIHLFTEALPVLGANIKRDLLLAAGVKEDDKSIPAEKKYIEDKRETHLVPIGKSLGVGAAMGWQFPSIMVWMIKGRDYWLWTTPDLWSGKQWAKV